MHYWIEFLCIFIIIIISILIYDLNAIPTINKLNPKPLKCCILLTMYVNNKKSLYENIVQRWLNETNLDIYIVDSSNTPLSIIHPRLFPYHFKQTDDFATLEPSKYEVDSILKANQYFNFKKYDMVIKVTGKYFIPDLERILHLIPDTDMVVQCRTDTYGRQNTEILAIKSSMIKILNQYNGKCNLETFIFQLKCVKHRFMLFKLDSFVPRGDGSILRCL